MRHINNKVFIFFSIFVFTLININVSTQVIIATESFNEPEGSRSGIMSDGVTPWDASNFGQCDSDEGFWGVNSNSKFEVNDIEGFDCCFCNRNFPTTENCGNSGSYIEFGPIDISSYNRISALFQLTFLATVNQLECFAQLEDPLHNTPCTEENEPDLRCFTTADQVMMTYSIDGNPEVPFAYFCGDEYCMGNGSFCEYMEGNNLRIRVYLGNQELSEFYYLDNVRITGYTEPFTEISVTPSLEICEGDAVTLSEIGGRANSWDWSGPAGMHSGRVWDVDNFTSALTGTYSITVSDPNGCTETQEVELTTTMLEATLEIDDLQLCVGECTSMEINITGGSSPYDIGMTAMYNGLPFPINQTVNATNFQVTLCATEGNSFDYNTATQTIQIGVDGSPNLVFALNSITSDDCTFDFTEEVTLGFIENPELPILGSFTFCGDDAGEATIDLNQFNNDVLNGLSGTVAWFSDNAGDNPIANPVKTSGSTFYAFLNDGTCTYGPVPVQIIIGPPPSLEIPADYAGCGNYIFLEIEGENLTGNEAYYFEPNGMGEMFTAGQATTTSGTYYVYDGVPGCEDEESFEVSIIEGPVIDPIVLDPACDFFILPPIEGANLTGNEAYFDGPDGLGNRYLPGEILTESIFLYAYDVNGDCDFEVSFEVIIIVTPSFTMPDEISNCGFIELPEIVGENLTGNEYYASNNGGGNPRYYAGDMISESVTLYVFDGSGFCFNAQLIEIIISAGQNLTGLPDIEACNEYVLPPIIITPPNDPKYYDAPLGAGTVYNSGDIITEDITLFIFDVDPDNPDCFVQEEFTITFEQDPIAGPDVTLNVCEGSIIDMRSLLGNNVDDYGTFSDDSNSGLLTGDILNLEGATIDNIEIEYYIVNACAGDTSYFNFNIVESVSAGNDEAPTLCANAIVSLFDLISGDAGGIFYDENGNIIESNIDFDTISGSSLTVQYIIGDGVSCPADTAELNIEILLTANFDQENEIQACESYELPVITGTNLSGEEIYSDQGDGSGATLPSGAILDESQVIYLIGGNVDCPVVDSFSLIINQPIERNATPMLCVDEEAIIGGVAYNFNNPTGVFVGIAENGCDSIVNISVARIFNDTTRINRTLCFGQTITVGGQVFDEINPIGEMVLDASLPNSCDSVILVNLVFADASINDIDTTLCARDQLIINGTIYNENNTSGSDTLLTVGGCDSIINVTIDIQMLEVSDIEEQLCQGETIVVNGTIYGENNLTGSEVVNDDGFGCDSIFNVNINLLLHEEIVMDSTLCSGETITINGTTYDVDNPNGTEVLSGQAANGCDIVTIVDLTFDELATSFVEGTYCPGFEIDIEGNIFNKNNPRGEVIVEKLNGKCDSLIVVDLSFYTVGEGIIEQSLCEGLSVDINGTIYDIDNPRGEFISQTLNGCDSITVINITFEAMELEYNVQQPDCETGIAAINFESINFESDSYTIIDENGNENTINIPGSFDIETSGVLFYTIQNADGCATDINISIEEIDDYIIEEFDPITIEKGETYQIEVNLPNRSTISWSPVEGLSCTDCANPKAMPEESTIYMYMITTLDGCVHEGSISIDVRARTTDFYIPNSFSPNRDNLNEQFYLQSEIDLEYDMTIFDRWGNMIFEGESLTSNEPSEGWKGTFKEIETAQGEYTYMIIVYDDENNNNEPQQFTGTITVFR